MPQQRLGQLGACSVDGADEQDRGFAGHCEAQIIYGLTNICFSAYKVKSQRLISPSKQLNPADHLHECHELRRYPRKIAYQAFPDIRIIIYMNIVINLSLTQKCVRCSTSPTVCSGLFAARRDGQDRTFAGGRFRPKGDVRQRRLSATNGHPYIQKVATSLNPDTPHNHTQ